MTVSPFIGSLLLNEKTKGGTTMKKLILIASLGLALLMPGLKAEDPVTNWLWTGTGWISITTTDGIEPLPPPPPVKI